MTTTALKLISRTFGQLAAVVSVGTAVLLFATAPLLAEERASVALEGTVESISITGTGERRVLVTLKERQDDRFQAPLSKALELGIVRQSPIEGFSVFTRMSVNDELQGQRVRLTVTKESEHRYNITRVQRTDTGQTGQPALKAQSESEKAGTSDNTPSPKSRVADSAENPTKPELSTPPPSKGEPALEGRDSSKGEDSILLKSGEIRTGRILNDAYTIKETKIETEPPEGRKAPIRIPGSNLQAVPAGDSRIIEYRRKATLTSKYSSWQVDSIVFSDAAGGTDEMLMDWGDKKAGTVVMDKVTIRLPSGKEEEIPREKIKQLKLYRE